MKPKLKNYHMYNRYSEFQREFVFIQSGVWRCRGAAEATEWREDLPGARSGSRRERSNGDYSTGETIVTHIHKQTSIYTDRHTHIHTIDILAHLCKH